MSLLYRMFKKDFGIEIGKFIESNWHMNEHYDYELPEEVNKKERQKLYKRYKDILSKRFEKSHNLEQEFISSIKTCHTNTLDYGLDLISVDLNLKKQFIDAQIQYAKTENDAYLDIIRQARIEKTINNQLLYSFCYENHLNNVLFPDQDLKEAIGFSLLYDYFKDENKWIIMGSGTGKFSINMLSLNKKSSIFSVDRAQSIKKHYNYYLENFYSDQKDNIAIRNTTIYANYLADELINKVNRTFDGVIYMFPDLINPSNLFKNAAIYTDSLCFVLLDVKIPNQIPKELKQLKKQRLSQKNLIDFIEDKSIDDYNSKIKEFLLERSQKIFSQLESYSNRIELTKAYEYEDGKFILLETVEI